MQSITDISINVIAVPTKTVEWTHQRAWVGIGNADQVWGEHSDVAPDIALEDAYRAYDEAVEYLDEARKLTRGTQDAKLKFYVRAAATAVGDALRQLRKVQAELS